MNLRFVATITGVTAMHWIMQDTAGMAQEHIHMKSGDAAAERSADRRPDVPLEQAMRAALDKVPGRIHEIDLMEKQGDTDWLFEVLTPDGHMVHVEVDSETGMVTRIAKPKPEHIVGIPDKGKKIYDRLCIACHGSEGKGDGPFGALLVPRAANLTSHGSHGHLKPDIEWFRTIREGREGTAMQGFGRVLSNQDIRNVLAYVRSLRE